MYCLIERCGAQLMSAHRTYRQAVMEKSRREGLDIQTDCFEPDSYYIEEVNDETEPMQ